MSAAPSADELRRVVRENARELGRLRPALLAAEAQLRATLDREHAARSGAVGRARLNRHLLEQLAERAGLLAVHVGALRDTIRSLEREATLAREKLDRLRAVEPQPRAGLPSQRSEGEDA